MTSRAKSAKPREIATERAMFGCRADLAIVFDGESWCADAGIFDHQTPPAFARSMTKPSAPSPASILRKCPGKGCFTSTGFLPDFWDRSFGVATASTNILEGRCALKLTVPSIDGYDTNDRVLDDRPLPGTPDGCSDFPKSATGHYSVQSIAEILDRNLVRANPGMDLCAHHPYGSATHPTKMSRRISWPRPSR